MMSLKTKSVVNHERHERHERGENKGPQSGWPASPDFTRLSATPKSTGRSPFVFFVSFVVSTACFLATCFRWFSCRRVALVGAWWLAAGALAAAELPAFTPGKQTIQFTASALQSAADEVKSRLHSIEEPGPFDITREKFQLIVPKTYAHAEPWGLFIWISAGDAPTIPADWEPVLAARKLLFVGAFKSGNPRSIFDRVRLAVDANIGMRRKFNVDGRRVYVSGFSGGARVASMIGVGYGDMFSGAIPFMGVNFYTELPAGEGKKFNVSYLPDDEVLELAKKKCRYVLVTGEKDFNRMNTRSAHEHGFKKEGFANVLYLEVPALGHALPGAKTLEQGIEFLDVGKGR